MYNESSRISTKKWRTKNKEKFNKYMRNYYDTPEQKEKKIEYYKKNLEKTKEYQKEYQKKYRLENKEKLYAYKRKWLKKHNEHFEKDKTI